MSDAPALSIKNLSKTYDNGFSALKGVDLTVPQGGFFALLGPNGAGKSTMIGIISSLFKPTTGSVHIFGTDLLENPSIAKQYLGVVPQEFNFNMFEKVEDILITQAGYFGIPAKEAKPRAKRLLTALGLWDKRDSKSRELSGGMKRRLMIARALIHKPKLLILDEPTAGVDIELRRSMWEFMQQINIEENTTIILTTHYLEEAEQLCKRIAILDHGEIRINTEMKELLAQLSVETFVFDLDTPLTEQLALTGVTGVSQPDEQTLEVTLTEGESLNGVFDQLSDKGISVASMRNKANRLEELFMRLVDKNIQSADSMKEAGL
ncbi:MULTISPECIES: ABC transporter ATP-binding protein [Psychrobacter]|jgi:ABC-2 type transport system ATP-binding protein|uniref:ABC transporter ATP-binding protein n=1 Tax=Psychrobacter proteolyticus TaxID=147825 RepID=A0ABV0D8J7_9GAMM|nr:MULTISPECIES: ABC transporter ATP-binding protein [Psychrobacter]MBA6243518.1 ABC transporter ATP-binding protein [Psychrobacter sp. Urea-trap-18]MBA6286124.1 ABC transporter ATP-binding protein [Psychrobacter sp. Urea-trap-16]MBA6317233.1 ABC transporter ATP-binding protein [Psychrobacter sp. Urea-trap-20]MBA6334323.1 ABC transporter ATP-binding protein [Psychrobacter sp. Urea-trap-19]MCG3842148.1 ABC transporter ATP-binding protein [Psychrobacter sp. Ps1]|tara:strand:+ start:23677 stop:24639 length:963 start_codon:yes stop_codon:yes gene_type:complete